MDDGARGVHGAGGGADRVFLFHFIAQFRNDLSADSELGGARLFPETVKRWTDFVCEPRDRQIEEIEALCGEDPQCGGLNEYYTRAVLDAACVFGHAFMASEAVFYTLTAAAAVVVAARFAFPDPFSSWAGGRLAVAVAACNLPFLAPLAWKLKGSVPRSHWVIAAAAVTMVGACPSVVSNSAAVFVGSSVGGQALVGRYGINVPAAYISLVASLTGLALAARSVYYLVRARADVGGSEGSEGLLKPGEEQAP